MSIELVNFTPANGEVKMTQVEPEEPVFPVEPVEAVVKPAGSRVDITRPATATDTSEFSHISLHQAARDGRADVINHWLFKRTASARRLKALNKLDEDSISPLHYAVRYGHLHIVKLLIDNGAMVDVEGLDGATPLHYAARFHSITSKIKLQSVSEQTLEDEVDNLNTENELKPKPIADDAISLSGDDGESIIEYLLSLKCDINNNDSYGQTPLHYAANKNNVAAAKKLLQHDEIRVDDRDSSSGTPLHAACGVGAVEIVQALVDRGADPRAKDYESSTPLHFACSEGHLNVVKLLLELGERQGGKDMVRNMLADKNSEKESALHAATDGGHLDIVELCIKSGSNVRDVRNNNTQPLHLAAISGEIHIAKLLISHGANIEARNANHETPLHRAAAFNRIQFVHYLLDKGANVECRDKNKFTPLLSAACEGHTLVVQGLLKRGANLTAEDIHSKTAIFMAAEENCVETLKELLDHPLSKTLINKGDIYEDTPLHVAAKKGFVIVAELLLNNGAKIDTMNEEEYTPLHLAANYGRTRTVMALLKRDSSIINDEDEMSNIPLHLAATEGHWKCVRELLENGSPVDARNAFLWTPLDCAAAKGFVKSAAILLDYDSPVDPTDRARTTPLHLASKEGHMEMVVLLLSRKADIALTDHTGRNCLDMAVDYGHKEVAAAIVKDKNWLNAMRNKTLEQGIVTTPMRKLIMKLPDVAEMVLNQCVTDNGLPVYHADYQVYMNYEFLEDVYADWYASKGGSMGSDTGSTQSFQPEKSEFGFQIIDDETMKEDATRQFERKGTHPLMIMIKKKREKLASHPLVSFLLDNKWRKYGRLIYYLKLLIYCVFLFFLTGYSVLTTENPAKVVNGTEGCTEVNVQSGAYKFFVNGGSVLIIILASWHILMELFQMFYQFQHYLDWENLLEWCTYVSSIVYVVPEFKGTDTYGLTKCSTWYNSIGAIAIFTAWMSLLLFIRKFPKLGIYVVMFTDIFYTFTKFSVIFVLFIVAFALSFFTLFGSNNNSFQSVGRSMVKTGVMMIGEFDFNSLFDPNSEMPALSWALFVIFLIVMTLILINLLIGLAVDDIKGVQDQAVLKRQAMLVDLALDVEKGLPRKLRKTLLMVRESFYPNHHRGLLRFFSQPPISPQEMKEALELEKSPMQKLEEQNESIGKNMKTMKARMKEMQKQQEQLQNMLHAVVQKLEITLEDDAPDEFEEESMFLHHVFE